MSSKKVIAVGVGILAVACQECHKDQHASWHRTFHRTMTQVASPETVLAEFNGQELRSWGQNFRFHQEGERLLVTMPDLAWQAQEMEQGHLPSDYQGDPPIKTYPVVMTTGSHNAQHYWVEGLKEEQPVRIPFVYLIGDKRLVPSTEAWLQPPGWWEQMHYFEHQSGLWNRACSSCHSLAARPGFNLDTGGMKTEVAELGISCESCHGAGQQHAELQRLHILSKDVKDALKTDELTSKDSIVNPLDLTHKQSTHLCGRCHSEYIQRDPVDYMVEEFSYQPGTLLDDWVNVSYFGEGKAKWIPETYWPDGTQRVSGDEFLGTTASACYLRGKMSCLSCHSMHDSEPENQLAAEMASNKACLQCHATIARDISQHTHHLADSSGSNCYNCHMPHTGYAFLRAQRTHRIDSPNVDNTLQSGKPNACNLCHLDKSLEWTASTLKEWYGTETKRGLPPSKNTSAAIEWFISGNAVQRAVVGWHFGWAPAHEASGTDWQLPVLAFGLDDPYSVVRYISHKATQKYAAPAMSNYDFLAEQSTRQSTQSELLKWSETNSNLDRLKELLPVAIKEQSWRERVEQMLKDRDETPIGLFE